MRPSFVSSWPWTWGLLRLRNGAAVFALTTILFDPASTRKPAFHPAACVGGPVQFHGGSVAGPPTELLSDATSGGMRISLNKVGKTSTCPIATRTTNGEASATTIMGVPAQGTP